jgi:peptidoglycan/xylan/chitin deacetylase (PgdA/CDA1 family)
VGHEVKFKLVADLIWKTAILMAVAFVMAAGLIFFTTASAWIKGQRPYYAGMYAALIRYDAGVAWDRLRGAGHTQAAAGAHAVSVPVLLYHGIGPKSKGEAISLGEFTNQMLALKRAGYATVSIQDYYDFMRRGKQLPSRSVLITFDDGRKDSYYPVQPVFKALGFRATMFVITKASLAGLSPKFYLSKTELEAMQASGHWDLQPHAAYGHFYYPIDSKGTPGHFYSNKIWRGSEGRLENDEEFAARVLADLKLAQYEMQTELGSNGIAFAFPYNEVGSAPNNYERAKLVLLSAVQLVYPMAFYQWSVNHGNTQNYPQDPSILMKRILIDESTTTAHLLQLLERSAAKPLPYHTDLTHPSSGWILTQGDLSWKSDGMVLTAAKDSNLSSAFLDGTGAWQDYSATARLRLASGQWDRIYARYYDVNNYTSCSYSSDGVLLEDTTGGVTHVLGEKPVPVQLADVNAGVAVHGSHIDCLIQGQTAVSSGSLPSELGYGGIGFAAYDTRPHAAELRVSDLKVDELKN